MFDVDQAVGDGVGDRAYRLGELVFSFLEKKRQVKKRLMEYPKPLFFVMLIEKNDVFYIIYSNKQWGRIQQ
jgi:hypothetical protein